MSRLLDLQSFFPEEMKLIKKTESNKKITLKIKSVTNKQKCPKCGCESSHYHSTYTRNIIDLPILGKSVLLGVTAYKYNCENPECRQKVFCEELGGFTGRYRRMTSRCEDLVTAIALNTSCETASIICKYMGISISGDTIIRLLLKRAKNNQSCGEIIGVDDWAYKKREKYGTIVCDIETRKPVAILDGRDGSELKEWLKNNKQVKIVTRDRAGSYAKAIVEVLPNATQVADRFHLHQNLFEAVKEAIGKIIPERVEIPETTDIIVPNNTVVLEESKKN